MNIGLDVSRLESQAKIVKGLAKIAILSSTTTILLVLYGFIIPDPVIFLAIVLIPVMVMITDNSIEKMYQKKTEFLLNDLQTKEFADEGVDSNQTGAKQSNYPNSAYLRIRGGDEKGPAFGKDNRNFSTNGTRIDAMANRDFDDVETISTDNEKMIRIADEIQSEIAAEQWSKSESMDKDLIEAGVENLGELIKSGWFEKNRQDDAVERLYKKKEGNQI